MDDYRIYLADVAEKQAVAVAEIVATFDAAEGESLLKTVLGAAAKAEVDHVAVKALMGQAVKLVLAEATVSLHHVVERAAEDVADTVFGKDITVAAVEVAVLLDDGAMPTDGLVDAEPSRTACEVADGGLDSLHELVTEVVLQPELGDGAKETAVGLGTDAIGGEATGYGGVSGVEARGDGDVLRVRLG